ncbi:MAG: hypothetical protein SR2Q5_07310 [Quinella sp. 2Q5]|nr:hypothetical protein [Quinella sp. 2Q5]
MQKKSEATLGELYYVVSLENNNIPDYWDDYEKVFDSNFGDLHNYRQFADDDSNLMISRNAVEEYTRKNLSDASATATLSDKWQSADATDAYNDEHVTGKIELKYQKIDGKNDKHGPLYYVVTLSENVRHFF